MSSPNVGDRVQLGDDEQIYVVVELDQEAGTASLVPEQELESVPFHEIVRDEDDCSPEKPETA
jgi:hypothetical protein